MGFRCSDSQKNVLAPRLIYRP